ncbi:winged helix-turn-helix domain-containing protein [Kribbella sp. NPDC050241]|uniref:winged helix-turn-helix domain-containing protein n=1 Tax=Kribbella sp. NPDC050241 TaxID=3364115 RepID=UPI0037977702
MPRTKTSNHTNRSPQTCGAIDSGILSPGDPLPTEKSLAERYGVAPSTAHRAVALLVAAGLVTASRGRRATVSLGGEAPLAASVIELVRSTQS